MVGVVTAVSRSSRHTLVKTNEASVQVSVLGFNIVEILGFSEMLLQLIWAIECVENMAAPSA